MANHYSQSAIKSTNVRIIKLRQAAVRGLLSAGYRWFPSATRKFIFKHFFTPQRYQPSAAALSFAQQGYALQIKVNGLTLYGRRLGRGPAVLFVHGWNGGGMQFYHYFKAFVDAGYSVMAFDAPGHGCSEGDDSNYFLISNTVRSILNSAAGRDIVAIVGHSLGASAVVNALDKEAFAPVTVLIAPAMRLKEILYNTFSYFGMPLTILKDLLSGMEHRFGYDLSVDNPFPMALRSSKATLIVHDREDPTTPYHDSAQVAAKNPYYDLYSTRGLGHKGVLKDPVVVDDVLSYIRQQLLPVASTAPKDRKASA
jgi:pimeloyl-ACP methyl ester carboxylesterase